MVYKVVFVGHILQRHECEFSFIIPVVFCLFIDTYKITFYAIFSLFFYSVFCCPRQPARLPVGLIVCVWWEEVWAVFRLPEPIIIIWKIHISWYPKLLAYFYWIFGSFLFSDILKRCFGNGTGFCLQVRRWGMSAQLVPLQKASLSHVTVNWSYCINSYD